jgi:hypothetical protein
MFLPYVFFAFIYYTDMLSITMVLATLWMYELEYHVMATITGGCSILCRQTNIVWMGYGVFYESLPKETKRRWVFEWGLSIFGHINRNILKYILSYGGICLEFMGFVLKNGSFTLGKSLWEWVDLFYARPLWNWTDVLRVFVDL